jgi:hypothetical protein
MDADSDDMIRWSSCTFLIVRLKYTPFLVIASKSPWILSNMPPASQLTRERSESGSAYLGVRVICPVLLQYWSARPEQSLTHVAGFRLPDTSDSEYVRLRNIAPFSEIDVLR